MKVKEGEQENICLVLLLSFIIFSICFHIVILFYFIFLFQYIYIYIYISNFTFIEKIKCSIEIQNLELNRLSHFLHSVSVQCSSLYFVVMLLGDTQKRKIFRSWIDDALIINKKFTLKRLNFSNFFKPKLIFRRQIKLIFSKYFQTNPQPPLPLEVI